MNTTKIQEGHVAQLIATLREDPTDWSLVLATLFELERLEYSDLDTVWAYASDYALKAVAELDGGQGVVEVWGKGHKICLDCWQELVQKPYPGFSVWNQPSIILLRRLRSVVEQSPAFFKYANPEMCAKQGCLTRLQGKRFFTSP